MSKQEFKILSSVIFATLLAISCKVANEPLSPSTGPTISLTEDAPLATSQPLPTPNYRYSEDDSLQVELGQLFALRWGQSARIPAEKLTIIHTTDIEFECPADAECEVPLIAADYFEVIENGESSGLLPWQPEMVIGNYLIVTAKFYKGYDYDEHQFEIVISVERQADVISSQQTKVAEYDFGGVSSNCGMTRYQFENREWHEPEVHMLAVREAALGQVDVHIARASVPMVLILSAYEPIQWHIHQDEGVQIEKIVLNGFNQQTVVGTERAPVIDHSDSENYIVKSVYTWNTSYLGYLNGLAPDWVYQMEIVAGAPLSTFLGCYQASEFTLK